MRNRELKALLAVLGALAIAGVLSALLEGPGWLTAVFILAMAAAFTAYLLWRNRRLGELSDYLRQVTNGEYALEIRDNDEGELSILKSEIYKVTHALTVQSEGLKEDKAFLLDSISDISHQLKTPITSISILTDLIADPDMEPEKRTEFIKGIHRGLDRVEWLVQSLLKLARLDASGVEFNLGPVELCTVVDRAAEPLAIPMEIKEQTLTVSGSGELICDPAWLSEAIGNVLKNCVEHTPRGGTIIADIEDNSLYLSLTIKDSGPGIPKEELPHIFKRFYRGAYASSDSVGIGLALSSSIISSLGGRIEAENAKTGGAQFNIKFYKGKWQ